MSFAARFSFLAALLFLSSSPPTLAYNIPETLNYELSWNGMKIGTSTQQTVLNGQSLEISSKVDSAAWSAPFYKVDDLETSRLNKTPKGFVLQSYKMKLHEGRNDWHRVVGINRQKKTFEFTNLKSFEKSSAKLVEWAWDPLSCLYYLRHQTLTPGKAIEVSVFDKKKVNRIRVNVLRREEVKTPAGSFRTVVISPDMEIESEGLFYARGPLTIWLSDDNKRVPVKIEKRINNLFKDGVPYYLQQFTPDSVRKNIPRMETITAELTGGSY